MKQSSNLHFISSSFAFSLYTHIDVRSLFLSLSLTLCVPLPHTHIHSRNHAILNNMFYLCILPNDLGLGFVSCDTEDVLNGIDINALVGGLGEGEADADVSSASTAGAAVAAALIAFVAVLF